MKTVDRGKIAFVLSLCLASFGFGVATMEFETFPYALLRSAKGSAVAWWQATFPNEEWDKAGPARSQLKEPTVRRHAENAGSELILVAGGKDYMTKGPEYGALAWLMDRKGTVKHLWSLPEDLWADLREVTTIPGRPVRCVGLHLYPNGDLLASFQGNNTWPFGIGIAKFDKDSKLIWKKEHHTHHWFSVGDDGRIYSPAHRVLDAPYALPGRSAKLPGQSGRILKDLVLVINPDDGSVIEEISMIDALVEADRVGLFHFDETWDPMHLNDVQVVTNELVKSHPLLAVGDLLVSFRDISTIGVLDGGTKRFKWLSAGVTLEQHSPRFLDGGVVSFDNLGGDDKTGGSRLTWVDITTGQSKTLFPKPDSSLPDPFLSKVAGRINLSSDDRRVLVALTNMGSIWEIDLASGEVVWEYLYTHPQRPGRRRQIQSAEYVTDATFPMNRITEHP